MTATAVYYHPRFLDHDTGSHPESAPRLVAVRRALSRSDLDFEWRTPAPCPLGALQRVHRPEYIERVRQLAADGGGYLDLDTAVSPLSFEAAGLAAGAGIDAVTAAVASGDRAFCLVRPPGHHARPDRGMGFCLFNSISVAAAHARAELGIERVLIVDWDVHHGNGTQEIFYADPAVLFCCMHQQWHYPGTGWPDEVGTGPGVGYSVNLPLPAGAGNGAARLFFEELVEPLAAAFRPQLILVSSGYDSQAGDRLGGFNLEESAFAWMAARVSRIATEQGAAGPVFFLEGGYVPDMLARSIVATLRSLDRDPADVGFSAQVHPGEAEALAATLAAVAPHWPGVLSEGA